jgi:lipooligosaccharide transport system ATP-binding protein
LKKNLQILSAEPLPLQVNHLSKSYKMGSGIMLEAVKDISFTIKAGECLGLLGPNGAGKSSAIHCISGFYPAQQGSVLIHGHNVHDEPRRARQFLGVCSQEDTLDSDFNVLDQLIRHATYFRIPVKSARERAIALLNRFGLIDKAAEQVESLSGGMRRRLQVARAMISDPRLLVLDEPTTGLDPEIRRMLWDALAENRKRGVGILLSTHYMEEAERICDRVAILSRGEILDIDSPQRLIKKHISQKAIKEEIRPGIFWKRIPNLEDVYLKLTGSRLGADAP